MATAQTFEEAFSQIKILVENFARNEAHFLSAKYQEAEVRQDFLDKFFVALGWDVYHHDNTNPYEREVKIEKSVIVQGRGKRADYAFYTAPNFAQVRFMAEAKKPSRQLENAQDCFQAIRYGWNSNAPISVLTDFEQFLVLDSRYKPAIETATQRIIRGKSFHYTDYADEEKFREIYHLFSREAVSNNSLETFAKDLKGGRGARQSKLFNTSIIQPIDEEFLAELDEQRLNLARAFKNRNPELDGETLTEITQRTLDRLVFLRFLEDKLVEPDSVIDNLGKSSGSAWRDFIAEMPRLNQIYNGTLFRTHAVLDNPDFAPESRAFRETQDWLAHANSPYDFNSIPIHILGSIYERFLGKTIETTDKRASVVDKPEVRKAGGVYYTPEYIVRYIVENTVGKLIEKKKPEEIARMRFADIACGSGSFLLGVFDYLIAYHVEWFSENKTRREKAVKDGVCRETIEGVLQLSISYKREILLNNIYGVDLDAQAVEVAQLSLYLKLLEEETTATKQQFLAGFREQLLPSLNKNIVHGNSLIDYDIDSGLFDFNDFKKLCPMSFETTFSQVFRNGGFDAIIGNPPYGALFNDVTKKYLFDKYTLIKGQPESYEYFIALAVNLCKQNGMISYIVPTNFIESERAEGLRKYLLDSGHIKTLSNFRYNVWKDNASEPLVIVYEKGQIREKSKTLVIHPNSIEEFSENFNAVEMNQDDWKETNKSRFLVRANAKIIKKIEDVKQCLDDICHISQGIIVYKTREDGQKNLYISESPSGKDWKKLLDTKSSLKRYEIFWGNRYLKYGTWLWCPRDAKYFEEPKIVFIRLRNKALTRKLIGAYDESKFYNRDNFNNIISKDKRYSLKFILALFNSNLLNYWYKAYFDNVNINPAQVKLLPIRKIDFDNPKEKAAHDKMVELVEKMLDAKKSLAGAQTDRDKTFFERYCSSLDAQIDALVYDLYDLTADEIKLIENS